MNTKYFSYSVAILITAMSISVTMSAGLFQAAGEVVKGAANVVEDTAKTVGNTGKALVGAPTDSNVEVKTIQVSPASKVDDGNAVDTAAAVDYKDTVISGEKETGSASNVGEVSNNAAPTTVRPIDKDELEMQPQQSDDNYDDNENDNDILFELDEEDDID
jgi:hypothetical protein